MFDGFQLDFECGKNQTKESVEKDALIFKKLKGQRLPLRRP